METSFTYTDKEGTTYNVHDIAQEFILGQGPTKEWFVLDALAGTWLLAFGNSYLGKELARAEVTRLSKISF